MATASFSKEMRFNEEESERLLDFIENHNTKIKRKMKMPPVEEAPDELLDQIFANNK